MLKEYRILLTALMFYTRIRVPKFEFEESYLNQSTKYLPLIGWIVGISATVSIYFLHFILPISICIILSTIVTIILTGGFHEDGFTDVCDGFGGGWTKTKILEIMKDSRVGAYGATGLNLLLLLKIFCLIELFSYNFNYGLTAIILAHVVSRFTAITTVFTHEYSREDATSKVKPIAKTITFKEIFIGFLITIPAFLLFNNLIFFIVLIPAYLSKIFLIKYFNKWIDGYTGDCLGAIQQVSEIIIYLSLLTIWKFIY